MHPFPRKKILVVDDDPEVAFALQKRLSRAGLAVVTASTGQEAIERAEHERPALITLDVRLPDMDGMEVASMLRRNPQTDAIPIVFITGKADRAFKEDCAADRGMYFIRKPYDPNLLIRVVNSLLAQDAPAELPCRSETESCQPAC